MKHELACQGSLSWSTITPLTPPTPHPSPPCALSSHACPCKECSHIWIQTQTLGHCLKTGSRLSNFPDLKEGQIWWALIRKSTALAVRSDASSVFYYWFPDKDLVEPRKLCLLTVRSKGGNNMSLKRHNTTQNKLLFAFPFPICQSCFLFAVTVILL